MQTAKASRKQSSLSGKESARGCIPKRLLGRPDEALGGGPLASRVAQGVSGPSSSCVWNPRVFADPLEKEMATRSSILDLEDPMDRAA